jgi:two-component system sensor histidine kinase BarA
MVKHQTFIPTQPSFRNQLLAFTAMGLVVFSLVPSLMTAWLVSGLAEQSILAVLTSSGENAKEDIEQVRRFPEVIAAKIMLPNSEVLIEQGEFTDSIDMDKVVAITEAQLIDENELFWIFAAPIKLEDLPRDSEKEDDEDEEDVTETIDQAENLVHGYSIVKMSKNTLAQENRVIVIYALLIGVIAVVIFAFLVNYGLSKLTQPLLNLAQVMLDAEKTGEHLRANVDGPK